jgi:uncharacterized protein
MATKEIFLPVGREQIAISVLEPPKSQIAVLFLFGGSRKKSRERFFGWQRDLFNNGISSVSFDYTGTGQSSGNFHDSSLAKRIGESVIVFEWMSHLFTVHQEIAICGGSMGAYIALGLMSHFKAAVKNLILFCPAAYTKEAPKSHQSA